MTEIPRNRAGYALQFICRGVELAHPHPRAQAAFPTVVWVMLALKQGLPPMPQRRNLHQVLRTEQPAPAVEEFYFHGHVLPAPVAAHDLARRPSPGVDSVVPSHLHPRAD